MVHFISNQCCRAVKIADWPVMECRCRIEFWPHWISTRGVLIQREVLEIQRIFHVELRPLETGGHCITTPPTDKIWTPVELWPRVSIPRWIMTPGLNFTLNCDPESWFNVQLWYGILMIIQCWTMTRVIIQREILKRGHNSTLNRDPGS